MNDFAEWLEPSAKWIPDLQAGVLDVNQGANRVVDAATGRFVGRLVPSNQFVRQWSELPVQPSAALKAVSASADLSKLTPAIEALQLTTSVGAMASVATLAVSSVGFAIVLHRLSRMDAKLDELLGKVELLQRAVTAVHTHVQALSVARIRAAAESLDRALHAETPSTRRELACHARDLFQESRLLYLELWRQADPWSAIDVPIRTAMEMQGRYVGCAVGEIQAEFVAGDLGAFRHAAEVAGRDLREHMGLDPARALEQRSDTACQRGRPYISLFQASIDRDVGDLRAASEVSNWSADRLESYSAEADLVVKQGVEPHDFVKRMQSDKKVELYLVRGCMSAVAAG